MRIVALGASNLTRGLPDVVASARAAWGPGHEVLAALGHGRSYGADSRVLLRTLPSILDCGLWRELERRTPAPTRALITDVGNDIPHGRRPERILAWVEECVSRLRAAGVEDVVLTDLPLPRLRRLSPSAYVFFRSLFFPRSRLPFAEALAAAEAVSAGLCSLARRRGLRLVQPRREWYGFDPIHIRRGARAAAWAQVVGGSPPRREPVAARLGGAWESVQLRRLRPERQWLLAFEQLTPQTHPELRRGGRVRLY